GLGQCGACTVLLEDKAVLSCITPVGATEGRRITTLEGLGTFDNPGPLQRASIEDKAAQCGFSIPGMNMRADTYLRRKTSPYDTDSGRTWELNLGVGGTTMGIVGAIRRGGAAMKSAAGEASFREASQ